MADRAHYMKSLVVQLLTWSCNDNSELLAVTLLYFSMTSSVNVSRSKGNKRERSWRYTTSSATAVPGITRKNAFQERLVANPDASRGYVTIAFHGSSGPRKRARDAGPAIIARALPISMTEGSAPK